MMASFEDIKRLERPARKKLLEDTKTHIVRSLLSSSLNRKDPITNLRVAMFSQNGAIYIRGTSHELSHSPNPHTLESYFVDPTQGSNESWESRFKSTLYAAIDRAYQHSYSYSDLSIVRKPVIRIYFGNMGNSLSNFSKRDEYSYRPQYEQSHNDGTISKTFSETSVSPYTTSTYVEFPINERILNSVSTRVNMYNFYANHPDVKELAEELINSPSDKKDFIRTKLGNRILFLLGYKSLTLETSFIVRHDPILFLKIELSKSIIYAQFRAFMERYYKQELEHLNSL